MMMAERLHWREREHYVLNGVRMSGFADDDARIVEYVFCLNINVSRNAHILCAHLNWCDIV